MSSQWRSGKNAPSTQKPRLLCPNKTSQKCTGDLKLYETSATCDANSLSSSKAPGVDASVVGHAPSHEGRLATDAGEASWGLALARTFYARLTKKAPYVLDALLHVWL